MLDFHNDRVVDECSLAKKEFVMTPSGMSRQGCRTSSCAHRSCQQEADAAHPAPARGRGKRNAGESGMPAGSGSCPSGASLGAVEAKCEQEAERRSRKCRPIVTCMEQVPVLTAKTLAPPS